MPDDVAALLEHIDDVVLVLGIDLGEAVGRFDGIGELARLRGVLFRRTVLASRMLGPSPTCLAISLPMAT